MNEWDIYPYRFPRLAFLIFSAHRKDGVVELTFEIPAAEGSEPPLLRRESSSSPASGESVVFSPEKKKCPNSGETQTAARGESAVL